jgi:hypothetical protein
VREADDQHLRLRNPVQQGAGDALTTKAVQLDDAQFKALSAAMAVAIAQAFSNITLPKS